jgi:phosphoribosyl-AMP cyclohydrolase
MSAFPERTQRAEVELGTTLQPKFGADGLIPCITQDHATGDVLMFAFMNAESLQHTLRSGKATYWSRSRNKLWMKGEESGNVQVVRELYTDCDQDVLLIKVEQTGPANASCHNGYRSCFYRTARAARRSILPARLHLPAALRPGDGVQEITAASELAVGRAHLRVRRDRLWRSIHG